MKYQIKRRDILGAYEYVIQVPACSLWSLLKCKRAFGYYAGYLGWNADVYHISNYVAIVAGYRPFGKLKPSYNLYNKYEEQAAKVLEAYGNDFKKCEKKLDFLIRNFVNECLRKERK